jgi:hypothetical protein
MTSFGYTLAQAITDVRSRFNEPTAGLVSDAEITIWLNQAQLNLQNRLHFMLKEYTFPVVADRVEYELPADFMGVQAGLIDEIPMRELTDKEYFAIFNGASSAPTAWGFRIVSKATGYAPGKSERWKISLVPVPTDAATATTLTGVHTNSATTLIVASTDGFPDHGTVLIGTEKIRYYAKTTTTFTQCVRGEEGTTAAGYTGGDAVTEQNVRLLYVYAPAVPASTSAYWEVPMEFQEILVMSALSQCHMKDGHIEKYAALQKKIYDMVEDYRESLCRRGEAMPHIQDGELVWEGDLGVQ